MNPADQPPPTVGTAPVQDRLGSFMVGLIDGSSPRKPVIVHPNDTGLTSPASTQHAAHVARGHSVADIVQAIKRASSKAGRSSSHWVHVFDESSLVRVRTRAKVSEYATNQSPPVHVAAGDVEYAVTSVMTRIEHERVRGGWQVVVLRSYTAFAQKLVSALRQTRWVFEEHIPGNSPGTVVARSTREHNSNRGGPKPSKIVNRNFRLIIVLSSSDVDHESSDMCFLRSRSIEAVVKDTIGSTPVGEQMKSFIQRTKNEHAHWYVPFEPHDATPVWNQLVFGLTFFHCALSTRLGRTGVSLQNDGCGMYHDHGSLPEHCLVHLLEEVYAYLKRVVANPRNPVDQNLDNDQVVRSLEWKHLRCLVCEAYAPFLHASETDEIAILAQMLEGVCSEALFAKSTLFRNMAINRNMGSWLSEDQEYPYQVPMAHIATSLDAFVEAVDTMPLIDDEEMLGLSKVNTTEARLSRWFWGNKAGSGPNSLARRARDILFGLNEWAGRSAASFSDLLRDDRRLHPCAQRKVTQSAMMIREGEDHEDDSLVLKAPCSSRYAMMTLGLFHSSVSREMLRRHLVRVLNDWLGEIIGPERVAIAQALRDLVHDSSASTQVVATPTAVAKHMLSELVKYQELCRLVVDSLAQPGDGGVLENVSGNKVPEAWINRSFPCTNQQGVWPWLTLLVDNARHVTDVCKELVSRYSENRCFTLEGIVVDGSTLFQVETLLSEVVLVFARRNKVGASRVVLEMQLHDEDDAPSLLDLEDTVVLRELFVHGASMDPSSGRFQKKKSHTTYLEPVSSIVHLTPRLAQQDKQVDGSSAQVAPTIWRATTTNHLKAVPVCLQIVLKPSGRGYRYRPHNQQAKKRRSFWFGCYLHRLLETEHMARHDPIALVLVEYEDEDTVLFWESRGPRLGVGTGESQARL